MTDADPTDETGPYAGATPQAHAWREAREWVEDIFRIVDDLGHLARTGVTRAFGRRLGLFVFSVEAAIRRLVLTLALQLKLAPAGKPTGTPARPPKAAAEPAAQPDAQLEGPRPIRVTFRLFAIRGSGRAPASSADPTTIHRTGPVLAIGRDPLLALGAPPPRPRKGQRGGGCWRPCESHDASSLRGMMHGRPENEDLNDLSSRLFSGRPDRDRPRHPRRPPSLRQDRDLQPTRGLAHDHLIPAPGLARRIAAMWNVMLDPMAFATRAARRLARLSHMIDALRARPEPVPPTFKDDRRPPPALGLLKRSHGLFARAHDTS